MFVTIDFLSRNVDSIGVTPRVRLLRHRSEVDAKYTRSEKFCDFGMTSHLHSPGMTFKFTDTRIGDEIFRLAVEACPCGMVVTDGAGTIVLANSEAETLFQYQRGELIG